ncbi:MAG: hypothetical protein HQL99_13345 [Magnetococcales bacterium]|nr:hypothetical protein [Magnetococcales bacterium]
MKRLGDVILPPQIQWMDQFEWSPVSQEVGRTLGGGLVSWDLPLDGGRPITLEAQTPVAWLTMEQVVAIQALSAQPGAVFGLEWGSEFFSVMFRHRDAPSVAFRPLWPNAGLFIGTIKLTQV